MMDIIPVVKCDSLDHEGFFLSPFSKPRILSKNSFMVQFVF